MPEITMTPEKLEALGHKLQAIVEGQEKADAAQAKVDETLEELKAGFETVTDNLEVETQRAKRDIDGLKAIMHKDLGVSGTQDWLMEMAKFVSGMWHAGNGMKVPDELSMSNGVKIEDLMSQARQEKAAADFTTGTASAPHAGYLLPEILRPGIVPLKDIYGNLYPRLTKFTAPAGVNIHMPKDVASPTANWRSGGQVTTIGEEATPMDFSRGTLNTEVLGCYIQISNELLKNPSVNFGAVATSRLLRAILKGVENGVLNADSSGAPPSDGLLVDTNVNNQGNVTSATFANVVTFLQACIADDDSASDEGQSTLLLTPTDMLALAAEAVGASELTGMLVWGNPRTGAPTTLLGYDVIKHPGMTATNRHMALADLSNIFLAEDPSFTIDVNPWLEKAFTENASWLRVFNHYDWELGQAGEMHKTTVGA